ncbi:MAG TPA: thiamine-phosphate kinase [Longimicrobiaceae bacterium]|nr:thiamine-phosphate kinase [Longimicrobiaceae bacterium]
MEGLGPGPEFDLIRRFLSGAVAGGGAVRVGPGDDCAVLANGTVLSTDMSVEGVHFRREWLSPREMGYRAAAAALSDLAAVAARPVGALVSLAVAPEDAEAWAEEVMAGVRGAVERAGGVLLGGDLTRSPALLALDVTAVGETSTPVLRSAAAVGDEVWVTGELGGAAACAMKLLAGGEPDPEARERFVRPTPRIPEAGWLQERGVLHAMLDLSDGLLGDAGHIAAASGVAVVLEADAIPVAAAARRSVATPEEALALAVSGGEDYELCFTAAPGAVGPLRAGFSHRFGISLTRVGRVEEGSGVWWREGENRRRPAAGGGFQHFGGGA